jgi:hypothetical protein
MVENEFSLDERNFIAACTAGGTAVGYSALGWALWGVGLTVLGPLAGGAFAAA